MSKVLVTESYLDNIADAIRLKNGTSTTYRPGDMANAIENIPTGITPTGTKNISQNGTHDVTEYASANVNVQPTLQSKTATQNGTVTPDQGYDGLSSVVVNVSGGGGGGISGEIKTSGGTLQYSGVNIDSQPVIDESGMTANASSGLSFSFSLKLVIEFDLILNASSSSNIVWSFGGSNANGGVYVISTSRFELYASGTRFLQNISLTAGVKYRMKMEFVGYQALLYADGVLIATGESSYVGYVMRQVVDGSIAMLYNQSAHSEFNASHVDNINISLEQVTA